MRLAVAGPGGIGGFVAAALARAGHHVGVVARGAHLDAIRSGGLHVASSDLGSFTAPVTAVDDLRELPLLDAVIVAFKSHQWQEALPQFERVAASGATVVTLQNGLPFWYVREPALESVDPGGKIGATFPDDARIVAGVVHVSGHIRAPGVVVQSGGMRYVLGTPDGRRTERLQAIYDAMASARLAPEIDPHVRATIWLKLVNNVGLNAVSTLRKMTIAALLAETNARVQVRTLMTEALRVGQALDFVEDADVEQRLAYAARLTDVKTSMLQDFERGRPLEIEPILGAVLELAQRAGVATPAVADAYRRLHELSSAHRAGR